MPLFLPSTQKSYLLISDWCLYSLGDGSQEDTGVPDSFLLLNPSQESGISIKIQAAPGYLHHFIVPATVSLATEFLGSVELQVDLPSSSWLSFSPDFPQQWPRPATWNKFLPPLIAFGHGICPTKRIELEHSLMRGQGSRVSHHLIILLSHTAKVLICSWQSRCKWHHYQSRKEEWVQCTFLPENDHVTTLCTYCSIFW